MIRRVRDVGARPMVRVIEVRGRGCRFLRSTEGQWSKR